MLVKNVYGCLFQSEAGESVGDERDMGLFYPVSMGLLATVPPIVIAHIFCASCAQAIIFLFSFWFHIK